MYDLAKLYASRKNILREMDEIDKAETAANRNYLENERFVTLQTELQKVNSDIEAAEAIEEDRKRREEVNRREDPITQSTEGRKTETRAPAGPFKCLGDNLMAIVRSSQPGALLDPRLAEQRAPTGLGEATGEAGGFLVQTDFSSEIWRRTYESGQIIQRVRRIPLSGNSNGTRIPYLDESSRVSGSRWGGVLAYRIAEAAAYTASKPKIGTWKVDVEKLGALVYLTDEIMQDAAQMEALVREIVPQEFAFAIEDEIINGNGAGKCLGILNAPALVTVAKESSQVAKTVVAENVINMRARQWARSRPNSIWLVNQDVETQLPQMSIKIKNVAGTENVGGYSVYQPANGFNGSDYDTLWNRPIVPVEYCPTLGTVGDIILFDPTQYVLVEKGGMDVASSIHVQFIYGEQVLRFTWRVNGRPLWASALTPFKGSNTLSPMVTLATRA